MNVSISRNGAEIGEWTEEQVRAFYREGQLLPTDLYWREGMTEWKELGTFVKPPAPAQPNIGEPKKQKSPKAISAGFSLGFILCLVGGGMFGLYYYLCDFDPSVDFMGGRINNIGLMQDRQNGIIISSLAVVLGFIMEAFRQIRK